MKNFFSPEEETQILEAIRSAELLTSGEIKLHVEAKCTGEPYVRAQEVFSSLKLDQTEQRNAVLIYWAKDSRKIAILGDLGIHERVPENFWQSTKDGMIDLFRADQIIPALVSGITSAGNQLQIYFPYKNDDQNEIPNDISFG